jgi:hypothetical protein
MRVGILYSIAREVAHVMEYSRTRRGATTSTKRSVP